MFNVDSFITEKFGHRLRIRVCGICIKEDKLLLVNHRMMGGLSHFWSPPGGGVRFGESVEDALRREFKEETGLDIHVGLFLFVHEFLSHPLHAIELFFEVNSISGVIRNGIDPELPMDKQIIQDVRYQDDYFLKYNQGPSVHGILNKTNRIKDILTMRGYYRT